MRLKFLPFLLLAASASAASFDCITNNSGACVLLEPQFSVVASENGNTVAFDFINQVTGYSSVITQVYFMYGSGMFVSTPVSLVGSSGVNFSSGANPSNLPAGNTVGFSSVFAVSANNPSPHNGIGIGDSLQVIMTRDSTPLNYDDIRIGIHVQSISINKLSGFSESLIATFTPPTETPEPLSFLLVGAGLVCGALRYRK